jgi:hypothetical protein
MVPARTDDGDNRQLVCIVSVWEHDVGMLVISRNTGGHVLVRI